MTIRASEPPINARRSLRDFVDPINFMLSPECKIASAGRGIGYQVAYKMTHVPKGVKGQPKPLGGQQIRAGRALIQWSAEDLSRASAVSVRTIRRAELADKDTSITAANDLAIRRALEAAGVEFIDGNGGGPGVRRRKSKQQRSTARE